MDEIAILIPCYNESKTIGKVISDFKRVIPNAKIYVCDNNSIDGSDRIAKDNGAIVLYEKRQGKANAIRKMFQEIDAKCYFMADGDDAFSVSLAKDMIELVLQEKCDIVIGDRLSSNYYKDQNRAFHGFGNRLVKLLVNTIFNANVADIMCGLRAMSFEFVKTCPILSGNFELETEMTIHTLDKRISYVNFPIDFKERIEGTESSMNTLLDGYRVLCTIIGLFLNYKPLNFLSIISIIIIIISTIVIIPVILYWLKNAAVPNFPRLIVCLISYVISIIVFLAGIILENNVKTNKQNFEIQFYNSKIYRKLLLGLKSDVE